MGRMSQPQRPATAAQFTVSVQPTYLEEHSNPAQHEYAWSYTVTITNTGSVPAQLVGRHWVITDATGHVEEVRGLAVVGHQPLIPPGEKFEYTSWTRLATPHGDMRGTFFCMSEDVHWFEAEIPTFGLARAHSLH
jgi:ApaG protein